MQKTAYLCRPRSLTRLYIIKILLIMKLTVFIIFIACLEVSANGYSQQISLSVKDVPVESVFTAIEQQTGFVVFYNQHMLQNARPISITVKKMPLGDFLKQLLKDQPINFAI